MKRWLLILPVLLGACASAPQRLDCAGAEELVAAALRREKPDMNPAVRFPVHEVTPADAWERMGVQIFQVDAEALVDARETFAVRQGQVVRLGSAFGGPGVESQQLEERGGEAPELTFRFTWGSGEMRTETGVLRIVDGELRVLAR